MVSASLPQELLWFRMWTQGGAMCPQSLPQTFRVASGKDGVHGGYLPALGGSRDRSRAYPDSGIEPMSSALQADSLPSEPPGKPAQMWAI